MALRAFYAFLPLYIHCRYNFFLCWKCIVQFKNRHQFFSLNNLICWWRKLVWLPFVVSLVFASWNILYILYFFWKCLMFLDGTEVLEELFDWQIWCVIFWIKLSCPKENERKIETIQLVFLEFSWEIIKIKKIIIITCK